MATLVIADDDPLVLATTKLLCEHVFGHRVAAVSRASEILGSLRSERPDLLLQDATMPGLALGDLLDSIRADPEFNSLPIVLFTGTGLLQERDFPQADAVIRKPFQPAALGGLIERLTCRER
jgi:CheY-like chemotaxis protein